MGTSVSVHELQEFLRSNHPPLVIDVRSAADFFADSVMFAGALRRDPGEVGAWAAELPRAAAVVACCAHGRKLSQDIAAALAQTGIAAQYLEGGLEAWKAAGGAVSSKPAGAGTRWVTRERPKIDRIACPWLIARFIDAQAQFLYVPTSEVLNAAAREHATPYDIPGVAFSHVGDLCSFDAFLQAYRLRDPALDRLALIVRGADTARFDLAPQAAGLAAVSLGLSRRFPDDHEMLRHGMVVYDALHLWCKEGQDETHTWNPAAYR